MDIRKLLQRKRHVKGVTFNLNAFSENQSLTDFRFPKSDVQKVARIIIYSGGRTARRGYCCDEITAGCIVMRRLAAPCRWRDIELTFGMRDYVLSEIFWESVEAFIDTYGELVSTLT